MSDDLSAMRTVFERGLIVSRTFLLLIGLLFASAAVGEEYESNLDRIAATGEFRIGFVPDAPPLSFIDNEGNPVGYSIDLCRRVASGIRDELGLDNIELTFTPLVSMQERLSAVEERRVDIECGATTVTLARRERVDFTLMTFITGSTVLSRTRDRVNSVADLDRKRIAVIAGTTTEDTMREFVEINDFDIELHMIATHDEGMELLNRGRVDGYASDRAMLLGQVFRSENAAAEYTMLSTVLSFEPYALVVPRGDSRFRLSADRALAALYRSVGIRRLYDRWFTRFGEPLSPIVEAMYQFQAVGE